MEIRSVQDDAEGQLRAYNAFKTMVDAYRAEHPKFEDDIFIAGVPIFIAEQKALMDRDMGTLFPLALAVVTMILLLFFHRSLGVLLPLVNVVMCTLWTLGLMAILQVPLDLITSVLPVLLITLCSADALHIMSDYYTNRAAGRDNRAATADTMRAMVSPVVLTTVTTVLGFLVGTASAISSTRTFGLFMAVGLVVAQVVSLFLIPAWLYLWGGRHLFKMPPAPPRDWLGPFLERRFTTLIDHRGRFGVLFAMLLVTAAVLATNLRVEDAGAEYFAADNPFRLADQFVNDHVAGTSPGWIAVQGNGAGSMTTLEAVRFLDELDRFLMAQEKITYSYYLPKYIKHIFYVLNDMDPTFRRLPEKQDLTTITDPATGVRERVAVDNEWMSQATPSGRG